MSTPEIKVRLTAEGEEQVMAAVRRVMRDAERQSGRATKSFVAMNGALFAMSRILTGLVAGFGALGLLNLARAGVANADAMGKLGQKIGTTTERANALAYAFRRAGADVGTLTVGTRRMNEQIAALERGDPNAIALFKAIGLDAKSFAGLDTAERLSVIAQAIGRYKDQAEKGIIATKLFGKTGQDWIPVLNDLSEGGLNPVIVKMRELGIAVTDDLAAAAQAAFDDLELVKTQAQAVALEFTAGFGPEIRQVMADASADLGKHGSGWKQFGHGVGVVIKFITIGFGLWVDFVGAQIDKLDTFLKTSGIRIAGYGEVVAKAFAGDFAEIPGVLARVGREIDAEEAALEVRHQERVARVKRRAELLKGGASERPVRSGSGVLDTDVPDDPGAEERARRAAEAEARRLAQLEAQRFRFEQKLLEVQGFRHEAAMAAIEEEIQKVDELLKAQGLSEAERSRRVGELRKALDAKLEFDEALAAAETSMEDLSAARTAINAQVERGIMSQEAAEARILEIERERIDTLRVLAAALLRAAEATGDPALIRRAEAFAAAIANVGVQIAKVDDRMKKLKEDALEAAEGGLAKFFASSIDGAHGLSDAMRLLALDVVSALRQIAAAALAQSIFGGITGFFGVGKTGGKAGGGLIDGPGTTTSDSIPTWLSRKEYVVPAAVSMQHGALAFLEDFRRHGMRALAWHVPGVRRMATGGSVDGATAGGAGGPLGALVELGLAEDLVVRKITTTKGSRAVLRVIGENRRTVQQLLGH